LILGFVDGGFVEGFVDEGFVDEGLVGGFVKGSEQWISMDQHGFAWKLQLPDTGRWTPEDSHRFRIDFALVSHGFH
jgi:hypothetical protein